MEIREMKNWEGFEASIRELEAERADLKAQRSPFEVSQFLFRGQGSSAWELKTTLEVRVRQTHLPCFEVSGHTSLC